MIEVALFTDASRSYKPHFIPAEMDNFYLVIFLGLSTGVILCILRILFVAFFTIKGWRKIIKRSSQTKVKTIIVIGSGGHTSEMMYLVESLNVARYSPRLYIMASSDTWSYQRVLEFEDKSKEKTSSFEIVKIPRSRNVHQSYFTSVFTTLHSILMSIPIVINFNPNLVLCNGPGTCIPICVVAFLMRCFFTSNNTIIFIESICRVKSLSLSGQILRCFADEILVQWPELLSYKRTKYIGRVV